MFDETLVDREDGDRVDLFVDLHEFAPCGVAVQGEAVGELPRELGVLQGEQREEHRVAGAGGQRRYHFVAEAGSTASCCVVKSCGRG